MYFEGFVLLKKEEPILFFSEIEEPGNVSLFATLKKIVDLQAKNNKPYLRLTLTDPNSKDILVQIWGDHEIYSPANLFIRKNLLQIGGPIHLIELAFDGEFISSSIQSKIDPLPTQNPIYQKYAQLNNYRLYKLVPEDPKILKELKKLTEVTPLVEAILNRLKDDGVLITEELFWEVTKLIVDKTYTGTIHLIMNQPQLAITPQYTNYVLKQLEILMIAFDQMIANDRIVPIILVRRLQKDLISLYDYQKTFEK